LKNCPQGETPKGWTHQGRPPGNSVLDDLTTGPSSVC